MNDNFNENQTNNRQPSDLRQPDSMQHLSEYESYRPYASYSPYSGQQPCQELLLTYPEWRGIKRAFSSVFMKAIFHAVGLTIVANIGFFIMTMCGYEFRVNDEGMQIFDWIYSIASRLPSILLCVGIFIYDKSVSHTPIKEYFPTEEITGKRILGFFGAAMLAYSVGQFSQYAVYYGCYSFGFSPISQDYATQTEYSMEYFISDILLTVIIGPVAEELMFRGVILRGLSGISGRFAIFVSAAMFGLMHGNLPQACAAFIFGIVLGYAAVKTGSLILPIAGHIMANLVATSCEIADCFFGETVSDMYWITVLLLFGAIGLCAVIYMASKGYIHFPEYTEYHRKRTFPVMITCVSFWILAIIYLFDILSKFEILAVG